MPKEGCLDGNIHSLSAATSCDEHLGRSECGTDVLVREAGRCGPVTQRLNKHYIGNMQQGICSRAKLAHSTRHQQDRVPPTKQKEAWGCTILQCQPALRGPQLKVARVCRHQHRARLSQVALLLMIPYRCSPSIGGN